MIRALYNALGLMIAPWAFILGQINRLRRGRLDEGWRERMGLLPSTIVRRGAGREVIWVHAASVGETVIAKTLIAALRRQRPHAVIFISNGTVTGRAMARTAHTDGVFYLPLDFPWAVRWAFRQLRPRLFVTIDTELWPNLVWTAAQLGIPTALANGRISDRSLRNIRRFGLAWFYRQFVPEVSALLMQTEEDARRIRYLGARPERVHVGGNLKADEAVPRVDADRLAWWRATLGLGDDAPVLLAGSTTPGEDEVLVDVFGRLRQDHPKARLVLVPRGLQHVPSIVQAVRERGLAIVRRTELPDQAARSQARRAVVVIDTLGELAELYAVADIVFVGRTLLPKGGSNVLQPAAHAKPILVGPHTSNFRESVALLESAGALQVVADEAALTAAVLTLAADAERRRAMGEAGQRVVDAHRGAAERTARALVALLERGRDE